MDALINVNGENFQTLQILLLTTLITLLPSIVVMMTSFTRTVIILSFTRNAMGIQQTPPNTVLVGISLFLTLYILGPILGRDNAEAYEPYTRGEITQMEAVQRMGVPIKEFMLRNTEKETLDHFVEMSGTQFHNQPVQYSVCPMLWHSLNYNNDFPKSPSSYLHGTWQYSLSPRISCLP